MMSNYLQSSGFRIIKALSCGSVFYSTYSHKILNCCDINHDLIEKQVTLFGWLHKTTLKGSIFVLRDHSGLIQLISNNDIVAKTIPNLESVIKIEGFVKRRPENQINTKMKTGEFEIYVDHLEVINEAETKLPFFIKDYHKSTEQTRMKYRYIDIRREEMQKNLKFRSQFEFGLCEFLIKFNQFLNIGTPSLFKTTPGGSREFIVPTHEPHKFYSLIQSPQQHKQLLMIGGVSRYMQLARCYRNETSRPDRQPEFTQLDIEMAFVNQAHLQKLVEDMLAHTLSSLWTERLETPFPVLEYSESMQLYGSDKPDMRFDMKLEQFDLDGDTLVGIRVTHEQLKCIGETKINKFLKDLSLTDRIQIMDSRQTKIFSKKSKDYLNNDFVITIKDSDNLDDYKSMGHIRLFVAGQLHELGKSIYDKPFAFAWIDRFPLFEYENGKYQSLHHQFTSPIPEHINLLYTDPLKVIGEQFDLICNGVEVGGGSIRIHNPDIQEYVIRDILKEDISLFHHLITALKSGAPPHGGFALGNDRLISVLNGTPSIRDVIAFPKTSDGRDMMSGAPNEISDELYEFYNIEVSKKSERNLS